MTSFTRIPLHAARVQGDENDILAGRRTPFGWATAAIGPGRTIRLVVDERWTGDAGTLRLTIALELWASGVIRVLDRDGVDLGSARVDHSDTWEAIDLSLTIPAERSRREVTLTADVDVLIFVEGGGTASHACPHILLPVAPTDAVSAVLGALTSTVSIQQFGWKEGCVLDGQVWLEAAYGDGRFHLAALDHLSRYARGDQLIYEDPWGYPADNSFYGIEAALPISAVVRNDPDHPLVDRFLEFVSDAVDADGLIVDGDQISAEGCYTIAYPLAVIARLRDREDYARLAMQQLSSRHAVLVRGGDVFLRAKRGVHTFKNWARAHAWYLLGIARTLGELPEAMWPADVRSGFLRGADTAVSLQLPDGLWRAFLDDDSTDVDSSGSAGIATALVAGVRLGLLPDVLLPVARRTHDALLGLVTPDGLLGGSTQANKAGESLQRSGYRVNSQMGSGLLAQLHAELVIAGAGSPRGVG